MTLTSALRTATSSLASSSKMLSVISRNISGVNNPDYVRRQGEVLINDSRTTRVEIARKVNQSVFSASVMANAKAARSEVVETGVDNLVMLQGGNDFSSSPAVLIENLKRAVKLAAAGPSDNSILKSMHQLGKQFANSINQGYDDLLTLRLKADKAIADGVDELTEMLERFEELNTQIVNGTKTDTDIMDQLDMRDKLINDISEQIGVSIIARENNDAMLVASNGVVLFEKKPRTIRFEATHIYGPDTKGGILYIDGVPVSGTDSVLPLKTGALAGNIALRDEILSDQQAQLDELARGVVEAFAEHDQSGAGLPDKAGYFTWSGGPAVPSSGTLQPGIALSLSVNPIVDPDQGGSLELVRDGGINGADYISNTTGAPGFSDRLFELVDQLAQARSFDAAARLETDISLEDYAKSSMDHLQSLRALVTDQASYESVLASHIKEALQAETGPNLDEEMSTLLEVERAYQASTKVMSTVDNMLEDLLQAV